MHQVLRLLESPSVVIRAKAFLVILTIITGNNDSLLVACQNRLVFYQKSLLCSKLSLSSALMQGKVTDPANTYF